MPMTGARPDLRRGHQPAGRPRPLSVPALSYDRGGRLIPRGGLGRSTVALVVAFCAGLSLLGLAWTLATPFGGSADEVAHYVKALGAGGGDLAGTRVVPPPGASSEATLLASVSRVFRVPAALNPSSPSDGVRCFIGNPARPASCAAAPTSTHTTSAVSYEGAFPPLAYVLPGVAARLESHPEAALLAARVANGLTCAVAWATGAAGFLAGTGGRRRRWLLAGLVATVTPAAVFLAWDLNPNGPEAAAGVAFVALALAATRDRAPRWLWWAMGPVGFLLGASRPVSFLWVGFGLLVPLLLRGRGALLAARRAGRAAVFGVGVAAAGALSTVVWDLAIGVHSTTGSRDWLAIADSGLHQFAALQAGAISQVDWGEVGLSGHLPLAWEVLVVGLVAAGLVGGTWRQRTGLVGISVAYLVVVVVMVGIKAGAGSPTGGRYLLAAAVALPLAAAEVCSHSRLYPRPAVLAAAVVITAATQVATLYDSARRYAVGIHGNPAFLWAGAHWGAIDGWPLVAFVALAGVSLIVFLLPAASRSPAWDEVAPGSRLTDQYAG